MKKYTVRLINLRDSGELKKYSFNEYSDALSCYDSMKKLDSVVNMCNKVVLYCIMSRSSLEYQKFQA